MTVDPGVVWSDVCEHVPVLVVLFILTFGSAWVFCFFFFNKTIHFIFLKQTVTQGGGRCEEKYPLFKATEETITFCKDMSHHLLPSYSMLYQYKYLSIYEHLKRKVV